MWQFYKRVLVSVPCLLFDATALWFKLLAVVGFFVTLANKPLVERVTVTWHGFSRWWSLMPVGALFFWSLLKANHELLLELERERAAVVKRLSDDLQAARALGPDRVASIAAEMERLREETSAQLVALSAEIDRLKPVGSQAPVQRKVLSVSYIEDSLLALEYTKLEVQRFREECTARLRAVGIHDEQRARQFFNDDAMRADLSEMYLKDLGRDPSKRRDMPLVDPRGLCTWGLRIHLAPLEDRAAVIAEIRDTLRALGRAGAE